MNLAPIFQQAQFLTAAAKLHQAPEDSGAEIAFAGRSNAGKSSALNALCQQKQLARTSKTPGRTQQLVFFRLDDQHRLVDLPGYGFARVGLALKAEWQRLMGSYLEQRQSLQGLVVMMDIRHPLTEIDQQMLTWGEQAGLPLLVLLTKADKLKRAPGERTVAEVRRRLASAQVAIEVQRFSVPERLGIDTAQQWIGERLGLISA